MRHKVQTAPPWWTKKIPCAGSQEGRNIMALIKRIREEEALMRERGEII